jgi:hypothetical protein
MPAINFWMAKPIFMKTDMYIVDWFIQKLVVGGFTNTHTAWRLHKPTLFFQE